MASSSSSKIVICLVLMTTALVQCANGASHTVGGSTGWTIPSTASLYSSWAGSQSFTVGDTLLFNFPTNVHNVMEVSKSEYDACSSTSPISSYTTGPATVTLNHTGTYYFICSVGQHCANGQKITLAVSAATSPAVSPVPSPATSPTAPTKSPVATSPVASPVPSTATSPTAPGKSPATSPKSPTPVSSPAPTGLSPSSRTAGGPAESTAKEPISPSSAPSVAVFGWMTLLAVMVPLVFSR